MILYKFHYIEPNYIILYRAVTLYCHTIIVFLINSPNLAVAAMPWVADYLLLPLMMNHLTAFGRGILGVGQAIRKLVPVGEVAEPKVSMQDQLKVTRCPHNFIRICLYIYMH